MNMVRYSSAYDESLAAVKALLLLMATRWPKKTVEIDAWYDSYVENLCGTQPNQRPLLSASQIMSIGRTVLNNWTAAWFPKPGDFVEARDALATRTKPKAGNTVDFSRVVAAGKKAWTWAGTPTLGDFWEGEYRDLLNGLDAADRVSAERHVATDIDRMKDHGHQQAKDRTPVQRVGGFKKVPVIPGINAPTAVPPEAKGERHE